MKSIISDEFPYNNIIFTSDKEELIFKSIIAPKINKEFLTCIATFTYITPNHLVLPLLHKISELSKKKCKIYIILWDFNIINYGTLVNNDFDTFVNDKIKELKGLIAKLGGNIENVSVITASDAWTRLINIKKPNLYLAFFKLLNDFNEYDIKENKIKYYLQYPADILFAYFFKLLYPEEEKSVDFILSGNNRLEIYDLTRKILLREGVINSRFPLMIYLKRIPRISVNNIYPSLGMSLEEITSIIIEDKSFSSKEDFNDLSEIIFNIINKFIFGKKELTKNEFIDLLSKSEQPKILLGQLIYYFFNFLINTPSKLSETSSIKNISSISELKNLSAVLKDRYSFKILKLANGSLSLTEMAKQIKIPISNLHKYVKKLIDTGLLEYDINKKLISKIEGFKVNFRVIKEKD